MRIARLDLTRYGKFTGTSLDFGRAAPGEPDLHVIYGPNEAGKSTIFSSLLDLLFGIEAKTPYDFIHKASMRIGAAVEIDGALRELVRVKKPGGLLDAEGRPVPDGLFMDAIAGIDRAAYKTMFSLDDETLEKGGDSILASKGDLGQLLFSASAGLADFSRALADLRVEADGFFKPYGRSHDLADLKKKLAGLKEKREAIDTLASKYGRLIADRDGAAARYAEAIGERGLSQARMDQVQRRLNALPRLAEWRADRATLDAAPDLPEAPAGWAAQLPDLQKGEVELDTRLAGVEAEIERLGADAAGLAVDDAILAVAGPIGRMADLRARHVTAAKDLPERRIQLAEATGAVALILRLTGREGEAAPERLVLPPAVIGGLRALIESRSGIQAALDAATREAEEAARRVATAQASLSIAGDDALAEDRDVKALGAVLRITKDDDHAARARVAARSSAAQRDALAERLTALLPWTGTADDLARLVVPEAADVASWKDRLAKAVLLVDRRRAERDTLTAERDRLAAEGALIADRDGLADDAEAAESRASRDAAWAAHRARLDADTADAFERLLRADDDVGKTRLDRSADVATLRQSRRARASTEAALVRAEALLREADDGLAAAEAVIRAGLQAVAPALAEPPSIARFEAWLGRRDKALDVRHALRQAEADHRQALADGALARDRLVAALGAARVPHAAEGGLDALVLAAQAAIDREGAAHSLRAALKSSRKDHADRVADLQRTEAADAGWHQAWAAACAGCWLGDGGAVPAVATVREALGHLAGLAAALGHRDGLADRIGKMEADQAAFAHDVAAIAGGLGLAVDGLGALGLSDTLSRRLQQATRAEAARTAKMQDLAAATARRLDTLDALALHRRRKAAMTAFFGVDTLAGVAAAIQASGQRDTLRRKIAALEAEIRQGLDVETIEAAVALLAAADRAGLTAELAELKARFEDQEQRARTLFAERSKAADAVDAVGGDDAAARLEEERRTVLLDIEDRALAHLRLRAGIVAAELALDAYRDKHRSAMMARASDAFRTISRGAYAGLAAQSTKDAETLIGLVAGGGSKSASDMSKGTRFQLYLALRVAGYHEFVQARRPVPFVADDIMETFDDFRAEEAFRLFAGMAATGQVIYLTHHRHLCAVARQACPGVKVHDLSGG